MTYGEWAVVTGANSGIGAAYVRALAAQGSKIVLVGRRAEALAATAATLLVETRIVVADLSETDAPAVVEAACDGLDIGLLVSNAGEIQMGSVLTTALDDLTQSLQLNAGAHLALAHRFGRRFVAQGRGGILFTSTLGALQSSPFSANYTAAKSYLLNLGMALNYELRNTGVHVTVVVPGPTKTPGLTGKGDVPIKSNAPAMEPEAVVKIALAALARNKPWVVPGAMNKLVALVSHLLGRRLSRNMFAALMRSIVPKDHRAEAGID